MGKDGPSIPFWDLLVDALMWPGSIEVLTVSMKDAVQLLLVKGEQVIETLATHTAQKAFTDGISARRMNRRFQDLDAGGCGHARATGSKLAIVITDEILRSHSIGGRFSKLLCRPRVGRRACDPHMDDSTRVYITNEEGKK
jgi:hypothetical protein